MWSKPHRYNKDHEIFLLLGPDAGYLLDSYFNCLSSFPTNFSSKCELGKIVPVCMVPGTYAVQVTVGLGNSTEITERYPGNST